MKGAKKEIAVVGTGYWGSNLVRNYYNLNALKSICDTNPDSIHRFTSKYSDIEGVTSLGEVLGDPQIKGVAIATPAISHYSIAFEALQAGKDVYIEKPLCLSVDEGQKLIALAEKKKLILMTGHLLWYHPAVLKLHEMVVHGELGRIRYIYSNRLNLGKLRREENVLWSFAPHDISLILGILDELPESVYCQGGNYLHNKIADTTLTMLEFPSGVQAHVFVSWLHPFKEQKLIVVGDKQMAVFDDTMPWSDKLKLYPHAIDWKGTTPIANKADAISVALEEGEPLRAECLHFLECIETRKQPRTDGKEGLRVLQVLKSCQQALEKRMNVIFKTITDEQDSEYFAHDSAVIDRGAIIGSGTKIWHFSHLLSKCSIGSNCSIGQNVVISNNVKIGNNCKIQNNVSVYEGVILEDNVFCGPSMVFTNVFNPRCEFPRRDQYKETIIKKGATIGANATIVCGITVGEYAFIGAGAVVTTDVKPFTLMIGNPARHVGWMSRFGKRLDLPLEGDGEVFCPYTGDHYILCNNSLQLLAK